MIGKIHLELEVSQLGTQVIGLLKAREALIGVTILYMFFVNLIGDKKFHEKSVIVKVFSLIYNQLSGMKKTGVILFQFVLYFVFAFVFSLITIEVGKLTSIMEVIAATTVVCKLAYSWDKISPKSA